MTKVVKFFFVVALISILLNSNIFAASRDTKKIVALSASLGGLTGIISGMLISGAIHRKHDKNYVYPL